MGKEVWWSLEYRPTDEPEPCIIARARSVNPPDAASTHVEAIRSYLARRGYDFDPACLVIERGHDAPASGPVRVIASHVNLGRS